MSDLHDLYREIPRGKAILTVDPTVVVSDSPAEDRVDLRDAWDMVCFFAEESGAAEDAVQFELAVRAMVGIDYQHYLSRHVGQRLLMYKNPIAITVRRMILSDGGDEYGLFLRDSREHRIRDSTARRYRAEPDEIRISRIHVVGDYMDTFSTTDSYAAAESYLSNFLGVPEQPT